MVFRGVCVAAALVSGTYATDASGVSHVIAGSAHDMASVNVCDIGTMQSPIDLHQCPVTIKGGSNDGEIMNIPNEREKLVFKYGADSATVTKVCSDEGCTVKIVPMSDVEVSEMMIVPVVPEMHYALDHCTLHMPSEHTINHKHFPLEVQCHHTMEHTNHRRKGVLSVMYQVGVNEENVGTSSSFIEAIAKGMPSTETETATLKNFQFSPAGSAGLSRYHTYKGSQTIGHCKEDADWYVLYDPTGVSAAQLDMLKKGMTDHPVGWKAPRPVQDLYGRHPEGCHHAEPDSAAPFSLGLSLAVLVLSIFGRS